MQWRERRQPRREDHEEWPGFRAEAFNVINHPNYYAPIDAITSANPSDFDTYQYARDPRQLQFALKLMF